MEVMARCTREKAEMLSQIQNKLITTISTKLEELQTKVGDREEYIFHERMREIVDLSEQNKAEAYLLRKRVMIRTGQREEEDLGIGSTAKSVTRPRQRATPVAPVGQVRPRKVEFESEEPLPDYVVMKDLKDVVDQVAKIPQEERERMFEVRVVEVDDIADFVDVKDELTKEEFAKNLRLREEGSSTGEFADTS